MMTCVQAGRLACRQAGCQAYRQECGLEGGQVGIEKSHEIHGGKYETLPAGLQAGRQEGRQAVRQEDRQTDKQAGKLTGKLAR
jgi:hypothetical protein